MLRQDSRACGNLIQYLATGWLLQQPGRWKELQPPHARACVCAQVLASNGFAARWDWEGIYAVASSRTPRDVRGRTLPVRFAIVDKRPLPGNATRGPYRVGVSLQVRNVITPK
jgi:hypothetical protein